MNDAFAAKVYPAILYTLSLVERIQSGRGHEPTVKDEMPRLKQYLAAFDTRGADREENELARAALTYWMDEVLINSSWSRADEWKNNTLERDLYGARDRAWEFFEKAKQARSQNQTNALETFFLCAALGFQGVYRGSEDRPAPTVPSRTATPLPPRPPASAGEQPTWFTEKSTGGRPGEEKTWGFGIGQAANTPGANAAPPPPPPPVSVPGRREAVPGPIAATSGRGQDLPRSLPEWAAQILAQISAGTRVFAPAAHPDSQRDARPLSGWSSLRRSLQLLVVMGLVTVVLAIWGIW